MITWFNAPNEGLSPGGQLTLKTLTATENKTYSEEGTAYTSVTVNVEGGGGSSDFSTAEVTVVNQKNSDISFIMPVIMEAEDDYPATVLSTTTMLAHSTVHNVAPLYKGEADATTDPGNTIAITGNATNEGEYIFITGDCTITIS